MRVLGVVAEYNPFHNGHRYHLTESERIGRTDCTVCVMSGNFTQRGEPAIIDKWARTKMALVSGVDLVIELPVVYSLSSAEYFAAAAVRILDSTRCVDIISFGSESGNTDDLKRVAVLLAEEPAGFKSSLKEHLDSGLSFPAARQKALHGLLPESSGIVDSPNNILGIEYLKALHRIRSNMEPITIRREGGAYRDIRTDSPTPGATAIRSRIRDLCLHTGRRDDLQGYISSVIPGLCSDIMMSEIAAGRGPVFIDGFEQMLLSAIRKSETSAIASALDVSEGLENRIKEAANGSGTYDELLTAILTRRYPATRVRRALLHLLIGISALDFMQFEDNGGPRYIRVLGFNAKGRKLLNIMKGKAVLPVITKFAHWQRLDDPLIAKMALLESMSTDIYALACPDPSQRKAGREYTADTVRLL